MPTASPTPPTPRETYASPRLGPLEVGADVCAVAETAGPGPALGAGAGTGAAATAFGSTSSLIETVDSAPSRTLTVAVPVT